MLPSPRFTVDYDSLRSGAGISIDVEFHFSGQPKRSLQVSAKNGWKEEAVRTAVENGGKRE